MKSALYSCASALLLLSSPSCGSTRDEVEVRAVIEKGNAAWVEAQESLDPSPLRTWFRGQALEDFIEDLDLSRKSESIALVDPPEIVFEKTAINAQNQEATVQTLETWLYTAYRVGSKECLFRGGPNTVRVIYRLRRENGRWQIESTSSKAQGERAPTRPCSSEAARSN